MNEIQRQVRKAQWRLTMARFGWACVWFLAGSFGVTAVLWLVPKIWAWETLQWGFSREQWYFGTAIIASTIGLIASLLVTWLRRARALDAAIEVDRRFGLRERISSALWLPPQDRETEVGQALLADAEQRAKRIAIADEFKFQPTRAAAWPLLPLAILAGLFFLPDAQPKPGLQTNPVVNKREKIKVEMEEIKQQIAEKAKQLEERGLKDLAEQMEAVAKRFDNPTGDPEELKKEAMVKINDLRRQLEEQQKQVGDAESLKASLEQLKKVTKGTGEKMAEAMAQGDMQEARKIVEDLARKLANGELTELEQKQLAENLKQLADEVKKMEARQADAMRELQEQINQARQQGNLQKAADLQKKMDQLEKSQQAMQKMQQMAQKLEKAADALKKDAQNKQAQQQNQQPGQPQDQQQNKQQPGQQSDQEKGQQPQEKQSQDAQQQSQEAQQALEDLAEQMEQLESAMEDMEALQDLEQDLRDVKDGMGRDAKGQNPGDPPDGAPMWQDWAKDGTEKANGGGKRDSQETETKEYRSRVAGKLQKGETVISGTADGENLTGKSLLEVREMVQSSMTQQSDPLEDQQLPKNQREHARQYFEGLRKGK